MSRPSFGELGGQDPYDILELPPDASDADVRAARKRLLRRYHPDLPTGDLRRTQLITAAADLLLDPIRRIGYYDLRDEESRRTVFARAGSGAAPTSGRSAGGGWAPGSATRGARGAPGQPIRPTFVTPPDHPDAPPRTATGTATGRPGSTTGRAAGSTAAAGSATGSAAAAESTAGPAAAADSTTIPVAPAAASRWNALAIASVVTILTWTPIPLVLGLLALRQIRRFGQRGTRLALTGVAVGGLLVLVYLYVLVFSGL
ncbi:DUF4190 domain-containing protein [Planosporangium sp. 12N6]|uniref:DUF4190 domain-containing protein n=1 Tax=Planosporangium spinosum TaxID=3402278 RepID=UPI003CEF2FBE